MSFTYPTPTTIDIFYTNADGYLVTPEKLPYGGGYTLVEVQAPYGYVLDSTPLRFDVIPENSEDDDSGITLIVVEKLNMAQKGTITVNKSGEVFATVVSSDEIYQPVYEIQGLAGAVYEITASEDIYTLDGTLRASAGQIVDTMLLLSLIFYLHYEAPKDEQNFPMVMELLRAGEVREDNEEYNSPLDELFAKLEDEEPDHIAVKYYADYHSGSAKTLKSIQITLAARLEKFNLQSLASLTATDELDLPSLGEKKVALFALIPDNDSSFNFLVSILYTQLFQQLFYIADHKHGGSLPVHCHFVMDEFANVSLPDDFDKILSVMRSRGVSVSIILQNLAQLKALFEKQWESIVGNCDEFLYLGGNEQSTHKYVSELLGKETIDTNTYGKSSGRSGNYSTNYQISGRELLTADEVRMLDNMYALLFVRGEKPIMDFKFDILKHTRVNETTDGKEKPYVHGKINQSTIDFNTEIGVSKEIPELGIIKTNYVLLTEEELENELIIMEENSNEKTKQN